MPIVGASQWVIMVTMYFECLVHYWCDGLTVEQFFVIQSTFMKVIMFTLQELNFQKMIHTIVLPGLIIDTYKIMLELGGFPHHQRIKPSLVSSELLSASQTKHYEFN